MACQTVDASPDNPAAAKPNTTPTDSHTHTAKTSKKTPSREAAHGPRRPPTTPPTAPRAPASPRARVPARAPDAPAADAAPAPPHRRLDMPHEGRSGHAHRDGRAPQHASGLMIGWRGALPAFLAKEAAYARGCARQASLPCRLLVGAHAERRMSAVQRRASPTKAALATLSGLWARVAASYLRLPRWRRSCTWSLLTLVACRRRRSERACPAAADALK